MVTETTEITKTIKLHLHVPEIDEDAFRALTGAYADACTHVSQDVFDNDFILSPYTLQDALYQEVRMEYGLKSQMAVSVFKTVVARYKTLKKQLASRPYKYKAIENGKECWMYINRTLEWLQEPIRFSRPQADLVHGRDYSFVDGGTMLSLNTLGKRIRVTFDMPNCFREYFDGTWKLGIGKLVNLKGEWYSQPAFLGVRHHEISKIQRGEYTLLDLL